MQAAPPPPPMRDFIVSRGGVRPRSRNSQVCRLAKSAEGKPWTLPLDNHIGKCTDAFSLILCGLGQMRHCVEMPCLPGTDMAPRCLRQAVECLTDIRYCFFWKPLALGSLQRAEKINIQHLSYQSHIYAKIKL